MSMEKNHVSKIIERPNETSNKKNSNIIDSRWIFKRKLQPNGKERFEARLVILGFKDKNVYELSETYAPVLRLTLKHRHLKGTTNLKLKYTDKEENIQGFSDTSYADCKNSLTTSGYLVKLNGDTITWKTHEQRYISLSTCQAEYVAMSDDSQEMISIMNSLKLILTNPPLPMILWCDNKAATASVEITGGNRLRHMINVKTDHVKECVKQKLIKVKWVKSKDQLADILTKPLAFDLHKRLTDEIINNKLTI